MSSIPSIFKKIHFSKINIINKKNDEKVFLAIILVNYKQIDFKTYISNLYKFLNNLSSQSFKIYFIDFSNKIDYDSYFRDEFKNLEIFLFKEKVDLLNLLFFISNEIDSDFIFYINTDYTLENIDVLEILKLFTDKNVGGITFGVYRGENYLQNYRYIFKKYNNSENSNKKKFSKKIDTIIELEIAKEFSITLFPLDEIFIIKSDLIKLLTRNYYKIYNLLLKRNDNDIISKLELGLVFILNNFYFIVNPYYHAKYNGKIQLINKINIKSKEYLLNILNYIYFEKPDFLNLFSLMLRMLFVGFSIKDIFRFKKLFLNSKIIESSKNIEKTEFLNKLINIFENY